MLLLTRRKTLKNRFQINFLISFFFSSYYYYFQLCTIICIVRYRFTYFWQSFSVSSFLFLISVVVWTVVFQFFGFSPKRTMVWKWQWTIGFYFAETCMHLHGEENNNHTGTYCETSHNIKMNINYRNSIN